MNALIDWYPILKWNINCTTVCHFRNSLVDGSEALFELVLSQFDTKGYVLRKGTLVQP